MRLFMFTVLAAPCAGAAMAQEAPLQRVYACAGIEKADERLACYDAAVSGLKQAEATGGVAVVSREQIAEAEKKAFGLGPATIADVAKSAPAAAAAPAQPDPLDKVMVSITSFTKSPRGQLRFVMADGQVWEEIDAGLGRLSSLPAPAEIRKAALGSFLLKVGDRAAVRVRRVK